MSTPLISGLDALADWRAGMAAGLRRMSNLLDSTGLLDETSQAQCSMLWQRLAVDALVLAVPGADGHSQSALTGALLSAAAGTSALTGSAWPVAACTTELAWHSQAAPSLRLLPLHGGTAPQNLAQLRDDPAQWHTLPLPLDDACALGQALQQLACTRQVAVDEARTLGIWSDHGTALNPRPGSDGQVTVPTWRHALINYPHPLLQHGLVLQLEPNSSPAPANEPPPTGAALADVMANMTANGLADGLTDGLKDGLKDGLRNLQRHLLRQVLPQHCDRLTSLVDDCLRSLRSTAHARLADRRRQTAEQLDDLQQLRSRSGTRLRQLTAQLESESADFERCTQQLVNLRAVLLHQVPAALDGLSADTVCAALQRMQDNCQTSLFQLGAARAFDQLGQTLQDQLGKTARALGDTDQLLQAKQRALNAEFGSQLACPRGPLLALASDTLDRILQSHRRYVGLAQRWRLAQDGFMGRFCLVLQARLGRVFDDAADETRAWASAATSEVEAQLGTRRRSLQHWRETHQRIRDAEAGLQGSIEALLAQQDRQHLQGTQLAAELAQLHRLVALGPATDDTPTPPTAWRLEATVAGMQSDTQHQALPQHPHHGLPLAASSVSPSGLAAALAQQTLAPQALASQAHLRCAPAARQASNPA